MFKLVPLHENRDLTETAATILNEEWPRSLSARLHSLEKSSANYPYSLVLLKDNALIGYSRLCPVSGISSACFVESVVICKSERGKGYGRILMNMTEQHAKTLNFSSCYLTTHDKQDFYKHMGYEFCEPVVSLGNSSHLLADKKFANLFTTIQNASSTVKPTMSLESNHSVKYSQSSSTVPLPPPPPPVQPTTTSHTKDSQQISWMRKLIM